MISKENAIEKIKKKWHKLKDLYDWQSDLDVVFMATSVKAKALRFASKLLQNDLDVV